MLDDLKNSATAMNLTLAFIGALLSNSFLDPTTRKMAWSNVLIGTTFAGITAPAMADIMKWQLPGFPATSAVVGASSFLLGLFAIVIINATMRIIKAHKVTEDA